ncbi:hypothetical protein BGZ49_001657 [Haplosporangium sp. Z 27]|nr:hypothetical protein BGZ49_001657 [Haplosporangium sp. Z 27]
MSSLTKRTSRRQLAETATQQATGEAEEQESTFDEGNDLNQILSGSETQIPDDEEDETVPGPSTRILPASLTEFRRMKPTVLVSGSDSETGRIASTRGKKRTAPMTLLSPEKLTPARVGKFSEQTLNQAMADMTAIFCQSLSAQVQALESNWQMITKYHFCQGEDNSKQRDYVLGSAIDYRPSH